MNIVAYTQMMVTTTLRAPFSARTKHLVSLESSR